MATRSQSSRDTIPIYSERVHRSIQQTAYVSKNQQDPGTCKFGGVARVKPLWVRSAVRPEAGGANAALDQQFQGPRGGRMADCGVRNYADEVQGGPLPQLDHRSNERQNGTRNSRGG